MNNNVLTLPVSNKAQVDQVEEDKLNLLAYLKEKLDNRSILIQIELSKTESTEKTFFTNKEKFEAMVSDNPAINDLRMKLGLELE